MWKLWLETNQGLELAILWPAMWRGQGSWHLSFGTTHAAQLMPPLFGRGIELGERPMGSRLTSLIAASRITIPQCRGGSYFQYLHSHKADIRQLYDEYTTTYTTTGFALVFRIHGTTSIWLPRVSLLLGIACAWNLQFRLENKYFEVVV